MKKSFVFGLLCLGLGIQFINADNVFVDDNQYFYYYGQTCSHCAKVEQYWDSSDIDEHMSIQKLEVTQNTDNMNDMLNRGDELGIPLSELGTPFLVIKKSDGTNGYLIGDKGIISLTQQLEQKWIELIEDESMENNIENIISGTNNEPSTNNSGTSIEEGDNENEGGENENNTSNMQENSLKERLGFFTIMIPAALSDSINPCAFAVMLLLLTVILSKSKDKKRVLLSGLAFALAVFVTYFLLGIGIFKLLGTMENLVVLKRIVGIIGILVGLANIKDFFRYGKGFVMEVPMAWRPAMQKIVKKVTSPIGAFLIGILISLFLLPCSSGPYLTILGYLSAENQGMTNRGYIYLTVYNLIFVLPMIAIAIIVGCGFATAEKIGAFKNKNTKLIHLIVGLLMLGLGIYILGSLYRR